MSPLPRAYTDDDVSEHAIDTVPPPPNGDAYSAETRVGSVPASVLAGLSVSPERNQDESHVALRAHPRVHDEPDEDTRMTDLASLSSISLRALPPPKFDAALSPMPFSPPPQTAPTFTPVFDSGSGASSTIVTGAPQTLGNSTRNRTQLLVGILISLAVILGISVYALLRVGHRL